MTLVDSGFGLRRVESRSPNRRIPALCAIVDAEAAARAGWRPLDLARAFLDGGARFLQLRAKALSGAEFLDTAAALVRARARATARGSSSTIARTSPGSPAPTASMSARTICRRQPCGRSSGSDAIVGLSTHTVEQLDRGGERAGELCRHRPGVRHGHEGDRATSVSGWRWSARRRRRTSARGLPLVAIGGITLENAPSVLAAGAASVAVIGDLLRSDDPANRVKAFLNALRR